MGIIWMIPLAIVSIIFVSLVGLKIYLKLKMGICRSTVDLMGKTVIVTGANTGIGYYTALDLARRHARVILACRSQERGQAAVDKIKAATQNDNVCVKLVDLSVMKSVRQFANDIIKTEDRLDVLVNNAGLSGLPKLTLTTEEGLEEQFAANYLGPFLLTNLLLDKLKQSAPSRIVNVSSMGHKWAKMPLDFDNFNSQKDYNIGNIYFTSKLGNVLFTRELARRLEGTEVATYVVHPGIVETEILRNWKPSFMLGLLFSIGYYFRKIFFVIITGVDVYCIHPGPVHTELYRHLPHVLDIAYQFLIRFSFKMIKEVIAVVYVDVTTYALHPGPVATKLLKKVWSKNLSFLREVAVLFIKTAEEGAQTSIYCAVSDEVRGQSGKYYQDCREAEGDSSEVSKDMGLAKKLWEWSERMTGLVSDKTD